MKRLKFPEDVRFILKRRYQNKHREWLNGLVEAEWPLEISLGIPLEQEALRQPEAVRCWIVAWQSWTGVGTIIWSERRWKTLGVQRLPARLCLEAPEAVALWIEEQASWQQASLRYQSFVANWPALKSTLSHYFDVLAHYSEADFQRLLKVLKWIIANPNSNLYPRQLPIPGIDSKWLESRKKILNGLVFAIQKEDHNDKNDFFQQCGLKQLPYLIRLRVLDDKLRRKIGGLSDITIPWEELASLELPISWVLIVENLQTGLAFDDMPGTVVLMRLGYSVDVLSRLPWLTHAKCFYWGDLDTHGFAILHRARSYLPQLRSMLMDEHTLLMHRELWVQEKEQHSSQELRLLSQPEQALYQRLKQQTWGQNVRLEQERIDWNYATSIKKRFLNVSSLVKMTYINRTTAFLIPLKEIFQAAE
jgi:hypothetical protein